MAADWTTNDEARARVVTLLGKAGVPLELAVAEITSRVTVELTRGNDVFAWSEPLVYESPQDPGIFREVDRLFVLYQELELDERTGVGLSFNAPIECKVREDVEMFLFRTEQVQVIKRFPIFGEFIGSRLGRRLRSTFGPLDQLAVGQFVSLKITSGRTPHAVEKEELIYKAGGAVYDFVGSELRTSHAERDFEAELVHDLGIFTAFNKFKEAKNWPWKFAFQHWINVIDEQLVADFNDASHPGQVTYGVHGHLPIVCVNSPLHEAKWNSERTDDTQFSTIGAAVTIIRKLHWPGPDRYYLQAQSPELPVVVTNPENLPAILRLLDAWRIAVREALTAAPPDEKARWRLEAGLFRAAHRAFESEDSLPYRSDHDFSSD
jgi:hypothetical protein